MTGDAPLTPAERAARLTTLLRYFSTLAQRARADTVEQHRDVSNQVSSLFFTEHDLRWVTDTALFIADLGTQRLPHLSRLRNIQTLHEGQQVLYAGWMWVTGTVQVDGEPTTLCFPLLEAPLEVQTNLAGLGFRAKLVGPPEPTPLLDDPSDEVMDLLLSFGGTDSAVDVAADRLWDLLLPHLDIPTDEKLVTADLMRSPTRIRNIAGLRLVAGGAFYVRTDARVGSRAHDLLSAATLDASGTALDHIYNGPTSTVGVADVPLATAPLTHTQRHLVARAVAEPVTVVAGPPGTGKTHAAVAAALGAVGAGQSVLVATTSRFAADVITERVREIHGLRFLRFGTDDSPARLFQASPTRAPKAAKGVGHALREIREYIWSALLRDLAIEEAMDQRSRGAASGIVVREGVDLDAARKRLRTATAEGGAIARFRARRARKRLAEMLGLAESTPTSVIETTLATFEAERAIDAAIAGGGISLTDQWASLEDAESAQFLANRHAVASRSAPKEQSQAVTLLGTALRSGPTQRHRKLQAMRPDSISSAIPLWIGTLGEIGSYLPLAPAMFDLIIIDEASHTTQLDSAPALLRAKRALVLGDPRQLRHVSFVADARMEEAATLLRLPADLHLLADVRRNSTFDASAAAAPTIWLDEHHRSTPHIIGFSIDRFYDQVAITTRHPRNERADTIDTVRVDGAVDGGRNEAEIDAVVELIRDLDDGERGSIGVVTPFRAQADRLEARFLEEFSGDEIQRLRLRVGTVHGFQGNQRDTMIVSTVVTAADLGSLQFAQNPNLFNVMVTRARRRMIVVTSVGVDDLPDGLLQSYLRHAESPPVPYFDAPPDPGWTTTLYEHLRQYDIRVIPEYPVGPYSVDLAVGEGDAAIGVETRVHSNGPTPHAERHLALRRAGWDLIDAFESRWLTRPEAAAQHIIETYLRRSVDGESPAGYRPGTGR